MQPCSLCNTNMEGQLTCSHMICAILRERGQWSVPILKNHCRPMVLIWLIFLLLVLNQFFKPNTHFASKTCFSVCDSNICDIYQSKLMTKIKIQPYLQHNQVMINAEHSHVRYTGWLCFCQRLPVGSETGRAVDESTIFLEPLCDMFLPLQSPYWCRVKSRQQSQIRVEVVYLAKVFHNLDKLDHIALPVLGFILLQNP